MPSSLDAVLADPDFADGEAFLVVPARDMAPGALWTTRPPPPLLPGG